MATNPSSQTHPIRDSLGSSRLCHLKYYHCLPMVEQKIKKKKLLSLNTFVLPLFILLIVSLSLFFLCWERFFYYFFLFWIIRQGQVSFPTCRPCTSDFPRLLSRAPPLLLRGPGRSAVTKVHFGLTSMREVVLIIGDSRDECAMSRRSCAIPRCIL